MDYKSNALTNLLRRLWMFLNQPPPAVAPETGSLLDHAISNGGQIETYDLDPRLNALKSYEASGLLTVHVDSGGPWASCSALVALTAEGRTKFLSPPQQSVMAG